MHQRDEMPCGLVERSRYARRTVKEVEEISLRYHLVLKPDVMAPAASQSRDIPGVLDVPVASWQHHASNHRQSAHRLGEGLSIPGHDTESEHPVSVLAAAGERPSAADPPTALDPFGRSHRLCRTDDDHIGTIAVDPFEDFSRQPRCECRASHRDYADPADRTFDAADCFHDLERRRHFKFEAAMTSRHE